MVKGSFTAPTMTRARTIRPRSRRQEGGFLLPLSATAALVLLLSSLSLQTAVLHSRRLHLLQAARQEQDDRLASAAHGMAAALSGRYRCLTPYSSEQWAAVAATTLCPAGLDPTALAGHSTAGHGVQLTQWRPGADGSGELHLQLGSQGPTSRWRLELAPTLALREVG